MYPFVQIELNSSVSMSRRGRPPYFRISRGTESGPVAVPGLSLWMAWVISSEVIGASRCRFVMLGYSEATSAYTICNQFWSRSVGGRGVQVWAARVWICAGSDISIPFWAVINGGGNFVFGD